MIILIVLPYGCFNKEERRDIQLEILIKNLIEHINNVPEQYKFYIIISEQISPTKYFNKGQVLNIGVKYFVENFKVPDFVIFHDIDIVPNDEMFKEYMNTNYDSYNILPQTTETYKNIYNNLKATEGSGVFLTRYTTFLKVNGYPNNYWGWGGEDNDISRRYKINNIKYHINKKGDFKNTDINRISKNTKNSYLIKNKLMNMMKNELLSTVYKTWYKNGVKQVNGYHIDSETGESPIIHIKVKLNEYLLKETIAQNKKIDEHIKYAVYKEKHWNLIHYQPNNIIKSIYKNNYVLDKDSNVIKYSSEFSSIDGWHLYQIIIKNDIHKCIEVGCNYGITSLYICQALQNTKRNDTLLISIDQNQNTKWKGIGVLNIERANLSKYHELYEKPSDMAFCSLVSKYNFNSFDLVLINGTHLFDYILLDIYYSTKLLKVGGVLVVHNNHKSTEDAIEYIKKNYTMLVFIDDTLAKHTSATFMKIKQDDRL